MVSDINALLKSVNAKKNNLTRQYPLNYSNYQQT